MVERIKIQGRPSEFEAAVIAVVLDRITGEERAAKQRRSPTPGDRFLPPWVRAVHNYGPGLPRETPRPE